MPREVCYQPFDCRFRAECRRADATLDLYRKTFALSVLTVKMLLLGSDHLLRSGLANGLGEALSGDAVPRGQQPVVDRLSRHTVCHTW